MARRKKKPISTGWLVVVALVVFGAAAVITYLVSGGARDTGAPAGEPGSNGARPSVSVTEEQCERVVTVLVAKATENEIVLVPVKKKSHVGGDILDVVVEMQLAANSGLTPPGTELLSPVEVTGNVATVNLSREFLENFPGGSTQEALTLNSLVRAVVDNSDGRVKKIRILVEGETVESLGGHFSLLEPFDASDTLLTPGISE